MVKTTTFATVAAITLAFASTTGPARADSLELGVLECVVDGGTGFIFGSSKELACEFIPANDSEAREPYFGVINKYGIDIGFTDTSVIQWAIVAPTTDYQYRLGSLAGTYRGVAAEASATAGAGVNVLVGGSEDTLSLQPVSVQTQEGVNIALGVAELELRSVSN
ncbi:DUF992 domain-containing protein [Hoeflea sp.]|uniref:DUF992 domain-containing protein n=1 Tax=Hoeflea sp. TaxID=1940281 RepID=UPI00374981CD